MGKLVKAFGLLALGFAIAGQAEVARAVHYHELPPAVRKKIAEHKGRKAAKKMQAKKPLLSFLHHG